MSRQEFNQINGRVICAMVTTASHTTWPSDIGLTDLKAAGLARACVVRFKLVTLPNSIVLRRAGALAQANRDNVLAKARSILL
jgi:mRNA interferase MazF